MLFFLSHKLNMYDLRKKNISGKNSLKYSHETHIINFNLSLSKNSYPYYRSSHTHTHSPIWLIN